MSLTVIQRFYDLAKQSSDAPALITWAEERPQELPWWFVKSKAKHFALGLLHEGARRGDFLYLFPGPRPNWIYADLGGLTIGAQTLVLPSHVGLPVLQQLFRNFPPAFLMGPQAVLERISPALHPLKHLKALIMDSDQLHPPPFEALPLKTFREVFNSGIVHEREQHAAYRENRRLLSEDMALSPIQILPDLSILHRPWTHTQVNQMAAQLSHHSRQKKIRRLFAGGELSVTLTRAVCLYWPLSLGIPAVLPSGSESVITQIHDAKSSGAYLEGEGLSELMNWVAQREEKRGDRPSRLPGMSLLRNWRDRMALRKSLGKNFQVLLTLEPFPDRFRRYLENSARVTTIQVKREWN